MRICAQAQHKASVLSDRIKRNIEKFSDSDRTSLEKEIEEYLKLESKVAGTVIFALYAISLNQASSY